MRLLLITLTILLPVLLIGQKRYEFDFSNKSLFEAVLEISKKNKFKFSYNPDALKNHLVNRKVKANSDAELISKVFEELPFKIQLSDGVYLVIPQKIRPKPVPLAGKVYDKDTGKPLAFAHVQSEKRGTISTQDGRFHLPPREDTLTLQVSYIGYKDVEIKIAPTEENVSLHLEQNPQILQEVILNTTQSSDLLGRPSFFSLNPERFNALPSLGETDVFKSIQLLPGIRATDETSSGLSVRGGFPSQNLILMDGFTLYHLDHFFGIFSTLNPNVIDNISIFKGGFGPEYGGRVSSVIDVSGKSATADSFSGGAGVNLLSLNGYIEAPIGEKTTLLLGGRRSFTDIINSDLYEDFLTSSRQGFLSSINEDIAGLNLLPSFHFYDFNGKLRHQFDDRSALDVNLYVSEDFYSGDFVDADDFSSYQVADEANWANAGLSLNFQQNFRPNWFGEFTFSASEYSDDEGLNIGQTIFENVSFGLDSISAFTDIQFLDYSVQSSVGDVSIKSDHEIELNEQSLIKAGIDFSSISTSYASDQLFFVSFNSDTSFAEELNVKADIASLYGSYRYNSESLVSNIGLRGSYYDPVGKWYLEPRFDIRFMINDNLHLKGAASYHNQFVNQTSLSVFQNSEKFYWVLADDDVIPILTSTHLIVGADYSIGNWSLDLEYYRKNTNGIIENQFLTLSPDVLSIIEEDELNLSGENNSQGLDIFLKYRTDRFNSWISYSLAESNNQFWYRNNNSPYPSIYDQRNEINFVNTYKIGKWELSSIFIYGSGKPFTPADLSDDRVLLYDIEKINSRRLPDYSRLDLSAKYSFNIGNVKGESGFTFFNLFNRRNIKSRRYAEQFLFDEDISNQLSLDQSRIIALDTYLLGFTPNFFFNIKF